MDTQTNYRLIQDHYRDLIRDAHIARSARLARQTRQSIRWMQRALLSLSDLLIHSGTQLQRFVQRRLPRTLQPDC